MHSTSSRFDNVDLTPQPLPPDLSAVTCHDALGWWIACRCTHGPDCHSGATFKPMRLLLERYHCDAVPVLEVARRLRCHRCGAQPSGLSLTDDAAGGLSGMRMRPAGGAALPVVIDLLPQLAAQARGASCALPVSGTTWLEPVTATNLARDPALPNQLAGQFGVRCAAR